MRCLTICAPFAELIMRGEKRIENRSRPTAYRGPVLVHAGRRREWSGISAAEWAARYGVEADALHAGDALGVVDVVDCVPVGELAESHPGMDGDTHAIGPFCWILDNPRRLSSRFGMRGSLGLIRATPELALRVHALVRETPQPIKIEGVSC